MRRSRKEYEQAIQGYDRAARLRPDDPQILYDRVSVYLEAGRAADALRVLDEPHKSRLVFSTGSLRALVHSALGQGDLALEEANSAVASNSGVWDGYFAYLGRGTIYRSRNDCARAVEDFSRAIALNIPDQTALAQRAECRITLKQYADAVADLTELITRSPKTPAYYLSRANAYSFMNDNEGAMHDYDEAVALDPKNPFALGNRAMLYGKMGRFADGMPYIDAAIKLKPDSVDLYRLRAQLETDLHQTDKAVADYSSALDLKPDDLEALNGRAWLLNLTGQFSKAIEDYNRSIKVDPKIAWTWVNRGHAYTNFIGAAVATRIWANTKRRSTIFRQLLSLRIPTWKPVIHAQNR
jgi:tetratricopeptide (TPR) repeat protein